MAYEVIHLKPTLDTSAYVDNDILFTAEAIKIPARACKVLAIQAVWNDTDAEAEELLIGFFRENVQALGGGANDAGAATNTLFRPDSGGFLGFLRISQDNTMEESLGGTCTLLASSTQVGTGSGTHLGPTAPIVVSSGTEDNKVYVSALLETSGGATVAADSLDIFIHVEY